MPKPAYQYYCINTPTKLVKEVFGDINVYEQNANL